MGEGKEKRAKNRNPPLILVNFNFILKAIIGERYESFCSFNTKN